MTAQVRFEIVSDRPFGRTNLMLPEVWLKPIPPADPADREALKLELRKLRTVIDVGAAPAYWGHELGQAECAFLLVRGGTAVETAKDGTHAADLMQAELLQQVCSLQRGRIDFFAFRVRKALEEFQLGGALDALQMARDDGLLSYALLVPEAPDLTVLSQWQFNDAFEGILFPCSYPARYRGALVDLARERRAGVAEESVEDTSVRPSCDATLYTIDSSAKLRQMEEKTAL